MITPTVDSVRIFLHILAAAVWAGGQLTLVGLVPVLRSVSPEAPALVARRFNVIAWAAFAVAVGTGIWSLAAIGLRGDAYQATVAAKLGVVALSGVAAALHAVSGSKAGKAVWGAIALLTALAAVFVGVLLRG